MATGRGMDAYTIMVTFGVIGILSLFLPLVIKPPPGPNRFGPRPPPQTFTGAIKTGFDKFFDFRGRASRSEFLYFLLFYYICIFALKLAANIAPIVKFAGAFLGLGLACAFFAVMARRLQDRNRSGWWLLLGLTGVGIIAVLILLILPPRDET